MTREEVGLILELLEAAYPNSDVLKPEYKMAIVRLALSAKDDE